MSRGHKFHNLGKVAEALLPGLDLMLLHTLLSLWPQPCFCASKLPNVSEMRLEYMNNSSTVNKTNNRMKWKTRGGGGGGGGYWNEGERSCWVRKKWRHGFGCEQRRRWETHEWMRGKGRGKVKGRGSREHSVCLLRSLLVGKYRDPDVTRKGAKVKPKN